MPTARPGRSEDEQTHRVERASGPGERGPELYKSTPKPPARLKTVEQKALWRHTARLLHRRGSLAKTDREVLTGYVITACGYFKALEDVVEKGDASEYRQVHQHLRTAFMDYCQALGLGTRQRTDPRIPFHPTTAPKPRQDKPQGDSAGGVEDLYPDI